jgi:hypothetical protein
MRRGIRATFMGFVVLLALLVIASQWLSYYVDAGPFHASTERAGVTVSHWPVSGWKFQVGWFVTGDGFDYLSVPHTLSLGSLRSVFLPWWLLLAPAIAATWLAIRLTRPRPRRGFPVNSIPPRSRLIQ